MASVPFLHFFHHRASSLRRSSTPVARVPAIHDEMNIRRRSEDKESANQTDKKTLVSLRLSSVSFLESKITDSATSKTLYSIQTVGTSTNICRSTDNGPIIVADIRWPKQSTLKKQRKVDVGTLVQMKDDRWKAGENFLTPQTTFNPPQFRIPGFSHSLKWKRMGSSYHCITSTVKGPIAILETATSITPARLLVFETLHDKYDTNPLSSHSGVSVLLLDYVVTTALLLVTDPQEWMIIPKSNRPITARESNLRPATTRSTTQESALPSAGNQWRKIVHGEPLFPSIKPQPDSPSDSQPATSEQMRKILYGESLFPKQSAHRRGTSETFLTMESESEEDEMMDTQEGGSTPSEFNLGTPSSRPWMSLPPEAMSPSAESTYYPLPSTPSAPHHAYLDPSFYNSPIPPVPPIASIYRTRSESTVHQIGENSQDSLLESAYSPLRSQTPSEQNFSSAIGRRTLTSYASSVSVASSHRRRLPRPPIDMSDRDDIYQTQSPFSHPRQKRSSTYSNGSPSLRSLPPTPAQAQAGAYPPIPQVPPLREKASTVSLRPRRAETESFPGARDTVFDMPPPAYHSIDFDGQSSGSAPATQVSFRSLPQPPMPTQ